MENGRGKMEKVKGEVGWMREDGRCKMERINLGPLQLLYVFNFN